MSESLGLSIGVANLVAARAGGAPVARTPVLTLFDQRPTEVGLPEENPNLTEPGLVLRGFVERVGDRTPLVAADGSKYTGEALTIEALEAMARTVGYGTPLTVAYPAYWSDGQVAALRAELFAQPDLARGGPPMLVSDANAAFGALKTNPGFPTNGVVALCDFGAGGTSVTLANAAANLQQLGPTARYREFSGDEIDQLILNHLMAAAPKAGDTADFAGAATGMGSVTRLLGGCRQAKERLSATTVATLPSSTPGADVPISRSEFDQLIAGPLDRFADFLADMLQRNGIDRLAGLTLVGGGASIPLIATRLSERFHAPVATTPQPGFSAAVGATALGQAQSAAAAAATGLAPAVDPTGITGAAGAVPGATAAWTAAGAGAAPTEAFSGTGDTATENALAWSEDAGTGQDPVPYAGPAEYTSPAEPAVDPGHGPTQDLAPADPEHPPWYRRPAIVLSLAGATAAILLALVLAMTLSSTNTKPVVTVTSQPPPYTTNVIGPDNSPTETVITPPPVTKTTEAPSSTTTTNPPTTTTTTTTATTTTTTTSPSTTSTTSTTQTTQTTQPTTTRPTTTAPPTTTQAPPTTTAAPPTTTAAPVAPTTAAPAPGG